MAPLSDYRGGGKMRLSPAIRLSRLVLLLFVSLASISGSGRAGEADRGFLDRVYRDTDGDHKYVVFVPENYSAEKRWPVILFLHGAGERGTDGKQQVEVGLGRAIRSRQEEFALIAVFPQCE